MSDERITEVERRIGNVENKIDILTEKLTDNMIDMIEKFSDIQKDAIKVQKETTNTLLEIQYSIQGLTKSHDRLKEDVEKMGCKIDANEKKNTIDIRNINKENFKGVLQKIAYFGTIAGALIFAWAIASGNI